MANPEKVLFLDIETTGLSWYYDSITMVGWLCNGTYHRYIAGEDSRLLLSALASAHTLVTFNGTLFDLRFLRKTFGELVLPPTHIDLRYLAKRVGLTRGQKAIESELRLTLRSGLEEMDGAEAVLLWHHYLRGDESALARLVHYNRCDVLGMCMILDEVLDRLEIHPDLLFAPPKFATRADDILRQSIPMGPIVAPRRPPGRTFATAFRGTVTEHATVIGIDLTGSEARASGWCVLRGNKAETCTVFTDDEMLSRVMAERPTLVSIDSPLSIPFGRTRVEDDDPSRNRFGILRRCERELKRRGINVYPCLLPSMQGLTRRGMKLAERFRQGGVPVIESYPGAAQDIMGIPRKRAGIEFLKRGLVDFGIQGGFRDTNVSHDELDAITSAIVGFFFLSGRYEALRGPLEDALVIPDLQAIKPKRMVIGISGRICAGKTTAARMLEELGFAYARFSMIIDDEIAARGELPTRERRQAVGMEINQTRGQRWLCEKILERVGDRELIVIDGLRFPEDHAFFIEQFGLAFIHLHLKAADSLRAMRYRESEQDETTFALADAQPVESKIDQLGRLASSIIENNGSVAILTENVLNSIASLSQKQDGACLSRLS